VQGPSQFIVTPLLAGPVCLLSQGQFEEACQAVKVVTDELG